MSVDDWMDDWDYGVAEEDEWMIGEGEMPIADVDTDQTFYLPEDYWTPDEDGTPKDFWSTPDEGIYDMDKETIDAYMQSGKGYSTTDKIEEWMEEYEAKEEDGVMPGVSKFIGENKELLYLLGSMGKTALDGYAASKRKTPARSSGGGSGRPVSASTPSSRIGVMKNV